MVVPQLGRLLIVDDELELTSALCEMLNAQGYEAVGFTRAGDALNALQEKGFDLLLTDLMMPEMDGIALLRSALEIDPHLVGIMMTGHGTVQTAVEAMKLGAFDYVLKPFKLSAMLPVLSRAIQVRRLRLENVQLRETVAVYELSTAIAYTLDLKTLVDKTVDAALQQLQADEASLLLPTRQDTELFVAAVRGENRERILGERVPLDQGIVGWVARHQEMLTLNGEVHDPRFAPIYPRPDLGSAISMPLLAGGKLVGVLNVSAKQHRPPFTLGQVKGLSILASIAAAALDSAGLFTQLREAESKYRAIFENAVEGIFQSTPEGRLNTANPALARMLGYASPQELIESITDVAQQVYVNPNRRTEFRRLMEAQGEVHGFELHLRRKDGSAMWVSENARAIRDPRGALLYYEGIMEDITERKRADERIQRQIERLNALRMIDLAITGSTDLNVTLDVVLQQVTSQLRVDATAVLLLNPHTQTLQYAAGRGFRTRGVERTRLGLGDRFAGKATLERTLISVPDLSAVPPPPALAKFMKTERFVSYIAMPLIAKGETKGMLEVFHRSPLDPDQEWLSFLEALARQSAIAIDNATLFDDLQRSNIDLMVAYDATIEGWSRALDLRDKETEGHTQRVTEMTERLARALAVSDAELRHMRRGALLHDIGKMGVPDAILLKPDKLSDEEWKIMRQHPQLAFEMLAPIVFLKPALEIPYCHHERWDGTGYPRGLKGEQIPLSARIFAVTDVWDALCSHRPYRGAWPEEQVREYIRAEAGKHFDPRVAQVFLETMSTAANARNASAP